MKKAIWIILAIVVLALFAYIWKTRLIMYTNEQYGFSFQYSASLKERYNESTLISLENYNDSLLVDAIAAENKDGYKKKVEELGIGYVNLLKIYNDEIKYDILSDETITVSKGTARAREVTIRVDNQGDVQIEKAVLIPAPNREITLIIRGTEKAMNANENLINQMIKSIKLY